MSQLSAVSFMISFKLFTLLWPSELSWPPLLVLTENRTSRSALYKKTVEKRHIEMTVIEFIIVAGLLKARLSWPRISENSDLSFVTLRWGYLYIVSPSVLSFNNPKLHEMKAVKNICQEDKMILRLSLNPGVSVNRLPNNPTRVLTGPSISAYLDYSFPQSEWFAFNVSSHPLMPTHFSYTSVILGLYYTKGSLLGIISY